jgi:uncharacterized protein
VRFEWDSEKAAENLGKHGVSFDEAAAVFFDPLSIAISDPEHSVGAAIHHLGGSSSGRVLVVAHTERGGRHDV